MAGKEILLAADEVSVAVMLKPRRAARTTRCRCARGRLWGSSEGLLEAKPQLPGAGQTLRMYLGYPLSHPKDKLCGVRPMGAGQHQQHRQIEAPMTSRRLAQSTKPPALATIFRGHS